MSIYQQNFIHYLKSWICNPKKYPQLKAAKYYGNRKYISDITKNYKFLSIKFFLLLYIISSLVILTNIWNNDIKKVEINVSMKIHLGMQFKTISLIFNLSLSFQSLLGRLSKIKLFSLKQQTTTTITPNKQPYHKTFPWEFL